jgi:hypothetical protein
LANNGIIRGYADGTFGPNDPTLRAQMAALIARTMGWEAEDHGNRFPDRGTVDANLWRNVGTLAARNVARGYADGTYDPTGKVLYAQVISFITRAMVAQQVWQAQPDNPALYPNIPASSGHRQDLATYTHYVGAVPGTTLTGVWAGWDQPATRGWFAQALYQAVFQGVFGMNVGGAAADATGFPDVRASTGEACAYSGSYSELFFYCYAPTGNRTIPWIYVLPAKQSFGSCYAAYYWAPSRTWRWLTAADVGGTASIGDRYFFSSWLCNLLYK